MSSYQKQIVLNFGDLLKALDVSYRVASPYLIVGNVDEYSGWQLHVSITAEDAERIVPQIILILVEAKASFMVVEDGSKLQDLVAGNYGALTAGKIISVFTFSDEQAATWERILIENTKDLRPFGIPSAAPLGSSVFTSYHGNQPKSGVKWPFRASEPDLGLASKRLYHNKYILSKILRTNSKGNVYLVYYFKNIFSVKKCVIKEARADASRNGWWDMNERLEWQGQVLTVLHGKISLPTLIDHFFEGGHYYLVMEYVRGCTLFQYLRNVYKGRQFGLLKRREKFKIFEIVTALLQFVKNLHSLGFVHRDINLGNFMVCATGKITGIDTELFFDRVHGIPKPPFFGGTPGLVSPQQLAMLDPIIEDDIYSIGAMLIHMFVVYPDALKMKPHELIADDNFQTENTMSSMFRVLTACVDPDSVKRPTIEQIMDVVAATKSKIS